MESKRCTTIHPTCLCVFVLMYVVVVWSFYARDCCLLTQFTTILFACVADNAGLQDDVLQFANTVLLLDHPKLCKALRTNILSIKVLSHVGTGLSFQVTRAECMKMCVLLGKEFHH